MTDIINSDEWAFLTAWHKEIGVSAVERILRNFRKN